MQSGLTLTMTGCGHKGQHNSSLSWQAIADIPESWILDFQLDSVSSYHFGQELYIDCNDT